MKTLEVLLLTPEKILFEGRAQRVILPGEEGTFEVGSFHRTLVSRLLPGVIVIDEHSFPIQRGVVKVEKNTVTSLSETDAFS